MRLNRPFILFVMLLLIGCSNDEVSPEYRWYEFIGTDPTVPYFPDITTNYFGLFFERVQNDRIGLVIEGEFPQVRYMSYHIYDDDKRTPVTKILDSQIQPNEGANNPFIDFVSQSTKKNYTLLIAPNVEHNLSFKNELSYDQQLRNISVILRYYVPEGNQYGNVSLPNFYYIDLDTGEPIDFKNTGIWPPSSLDEDVKKVSRLLDLTEILQEGRDVEFYRFNGAGLYPNLDNNYLFNNLRLLPEQVIMLKFKPPTYPQTLQNISDSDVRYYSIIIGDRLTYTHQTYYDDQFHIASDGFAYIVIGRADEEVLVKSAGLNFIEWPANIDNKGILIYRNLVTNPAYPYNLTHIPDITENLLQAFFNKEALQASTTIGDYAPSGRIMERDDFLINFDGFEVEY